MGVPVVSSDSSVASYQFRKRTWYQAELVNSEQLERGSRKLILEPPAKCSIASFCQSRKVYNTLNRVEGKDFQSRGAYDVTGYCLFLTEEMSKDPLYGR